MKSVSFPPTETKSFILPRVSLGGSGLEPEGRVGFLWIGKSGKRAQRHRKSGTFGGCH